MLVCTLYKKSHKCFSNCKANRLHQVLFGFDVYNRTGSNHSQVMSVGHTTCNGLIIQCNITIATVPHLAIYAFASASPHWGAM